MLIANVFFFLKKRGRQKKILAKCQLVITLMMGVLQNYTLLDERREREKKNKGKKKNRDKDNNNNQKAIVCALQDIHTGTFFPTSFSQHEHMERHQKPNITCFVFQFSSSFHM